MINESWPWREKLLEILGQLWLMSQGKERVGDEEGFELEFMIFSSAFIMRKLIESGKITDELRMQRFEVQAHPAVNDSDWSLNMLPITRFIDRQFDLERASLYETNCWDLVSEIMHSGFFGQVFDESCEKMSGFYVSSVRNGNQRILYVDIFGYMYLIHSIANCRVTVFYTAENGDGKMLYKRE